ncbi:carboxymuconolactone decarboxylase family protein [uncultured Microbulbifer sp.]|uniref:carboxymuconolactone decarboxylase family protein n=1 Tax=uncultured Microbulbifer sp. TaxID=348147 RepID=UPI0025ED64B1|nr:carboxymuconolactone decarboxylase family protein [uncultured Microbulbifer sp.]
MSRISMVVQPADERVHAIFEDIRTQLGEIPDIFRVYANDPPLLELMWQQYSNLMLLGNLSPHLKEGIALMVSADNHCDSGIALHSSHLTRLGVDPKEVLRIRTDPDHAHFEPKDHALLEVARHTIISPHDHGEKQIKLARVDGANDAEILEAMAVAGLITGLNKVADMLGM